MTDGSETCGLSLLESNMGVSDQEGAEDGVHDRVEGASGEGSDGEGDQTDADGAGSKLAISESRGDCSCIVALENVTYRSKVQW